MKYEIKVGKVLAFRDRFIDLISRKADVNRQVLSTFIRDDICFELKREWNDYIVNDCDPVYITPFRKVGGKIIDLFPEDFEDLIEEVKDEKNL